MKIVKIVIVVMAIALIAFFTWKGIVPVEKVETVSATKNPYTIRIENEVDSLSKIDRLGSCQKFYQDVQYRLNSYYNEKLLSKNEIENERWRDILSKKMYSAYAAIFVNNTFELFNSSEWPVADLKVIKGEVYNIKQSPFLERGSDVELKLRQIQSALLKYDEITGFIASCKAFHYSGLNLSDKFPLSTVENKINRSRAYLDANLENSYVKNCTRLRSELSDISEILFKSHCNYLESKLIHWSGMYENYSSQGEYVNSLYSLLKSELAQLDNNIYKTQGYDYAYGQLYQRLSTDQRNARLFFNNK